MFTKTYLRLSLLALLMPALLPSSTLRLDPPFGEHMVLQRGRPVSIQGRAKPGAELKLRLAGVKARAKADRQGRWSAEFAALPVGGPYVMSLETETEHLDLTDVMVGEVWLASGQSNMEWTLNNTTDVSTELPKAKRPLLRLYNLPQNLSVAQGKELPGAWQLCEPETAKSFSAVAYHFGVELSQRLGVPVGLVSVPWSGTPAETWTPTDAIKAVPELAVVLKREADRPAAEKAMFEDGWNFRLEFKDLRFIPKDPKAAAFAVPASAWAAAGAPGSKVKASAGSFSGNVPPGAWAASTGALGPAGQGMDLRDVAAIEFQARGDSKFDVALSQPNIKDGDAPFLREFTATKEWTAFRMELADLKQQGWGAPMPLTLQSMDAVVFRLRSPNQFPDKPGLLFEAMIRPFAPLRPRGAIWYQGESNAGRAAEYGHLLRALIQGWRDALGVPDLAFITVQLPEFGKLAPPGAESGWAELRFEQSKTLDLSHTGLAMALDHGVVDDIHPRNKKPVGQRLAFEALGRVYGQKGRGHGPRFEKLELDAHGATLRFDSPLAAARGAKANALRGMAVQDAKGNWAWAPCSLSGGKLRVKLPKGAQKLRYAWGDVPVGDLRGKDGLPALPFSLDLPFKD